MFGEAGAQAQAGGADFLCAQPVGEAGDEEAVHAHGEEDLGAGRDSGEGEGGGFVFGEAVEVGLGEGDVEGFAQGAGGGDPFGDVVGRNRDGVAASGGELVLGGEGELGEDGGQVFGGDFARVGEICAPVEGAGACVAEMFGEAVGLEGVPVFLGVGYVAAHGGSCGAEDSACRRSCQRRF